MGDVIDLTDVFRDRLNAHLPNLLPMVHRIVSGELPVKNAFKDYEDCLVYILKDWAKRIEAEL